MLCFKNDKGKTPFLSQSSVAYKLTCPGCCSNNVGKIKPRNRGKEEEQGSMHTPIKKYQIKCNLRA